MGIVWTNRNPNQSVLKRTVSSELRLGSASVKVVGILVFALLSIFYIYQSNSLATRTYLVKELEEQKEDIIAENDQLRYEAERLKNLSEVENKAKEQGMVEVEQVDAAVRD